MKIKVWLKVLAGVLGREQRFCGLCGNDTRHQFVPADYILMRLKNDLDREITLCYDCFCDLCGKAGLPTTWKLIDTKKG